MTLCNSDLQPKLLLTEFDTLTNEAQALMIIHFFSSHNQNSLKHFASICFLQRTDHSKSEKKNDDADKNGHVNGIIKSNKASDYYIKSDELTSNLTQRRLTHDQEQ